MIDLKNDNGIATVTITHGKANALDIELSEELGGVARANFQIWRRAPVVITGCAGPDIFGRRRPHPLKFRGAGLRAQVPPGAAPVF